MRLPLLGLAGFVLVLAAGGCGNDATSPAHKTPPTPILSAEPRFTPGTVNTVVWSFTAKADDREFLAQAATSPAFDEIITASGWTHAREHTFTDLENGRSYHYRVRARNATGDLSMWSASTSSIQDATPPQLDVTPLASSQTSLRLRIAATASDSLSGLASLELWAARGDDDLSLHGVFTGETIEYLAEAGGSHRFAIVARDQVGNAAGDELQAVQTTQVPEPIHITDQLGETWEITNAVLAHGMSLWGWDHGIGRDTIRPIIDPEHLCLGDRGYPGADEVFICLVMIDDQGEESLAMPLNPMYSHEVLDDEFAGDPIAMTY